MMKIIYNSSNNPKTKFLKLLVVKEKELITDETIVLGTIHRYFVIYKFFFMQDSKYFKFKFTNKEGAYNKWKK